MVKRLAGGLISCLLVGILAVAAILAGKWGQQLNPANGGFAITQITANCDGSGQVFWDGNNPGNITLTLYDKHGGNGTQFVPADPLIQITVPADATSPYSYQLDLSTWTGQPHYRVDSNYNTKSPSLSCGSESTATPTVTASATEENTATSTATATETEKTPPTETPTPTETLTPQPTSTGTPTQTQVPDTATPTETQSVEATATKSPTPQEVPSATETQTKAPPTATLSPTPGPSPTASNTPPVEASATPTNPGPGPSPTVTQTAPPDKGTVYLTIKSECKAGFYAVVVNFGGDGNIVFHLNGVDYSDKGDHVVVLPAGKVYHWSITYDSSLTLIGPGSEGDIDATQPCAVSTGSPVPTPSATPGSTTPPPPGGSGIPWGLVIGVLLIVGLPVSGLLLLSRRRVAS